MATLKTIADTVGVSVRTVGRALHGNGYVRTDLRRHIRETAARLDYRPDRAARSLRTRRACDVAVLMHSVDQTSRA